MAPSALSNGFDGEDILLSRLRDEAKEILDSGGDPATHRFLEDTILSPSVNTFEDAVANVAAHRLTVFCPSAFPLQAGNEDGTLRCRVRHTSFDSSKVPYNPQNWRLAIL